MLTTEPFNRCWQAGATLVACLIACVVFSFAITCFLRLSLSGMRQLQRAEQADIATLLQQTLQLDTQFVAPTAWQQALPHSQQILLPASDHENRRVRWQVPIWASEQSGQTQQDWMILRWSANAG